MSKHIGIILQLLLFAGAAFAFVAALLDSWWFIAGLLVAVPSYTAIVLIYLDEKAHMK